MELAKSLYYWLYQHYSSSLNIYLIIDGSRDESLYVKIQELGEDADCLYKGEMSLPYRSAAPHIIALNGQNDHRGNRILSMEATQLLQQVIMQGCGLVVLTPVSFAELYRHCRHLLRIRHDDGEYVYFRFFSLFYLNIWLKTAAPLQQQKFFGPISFIYAALESSEQLSCWYLNTQAELAVTKMMLADTVEDNIHQKKSSAVALNTTLSAQSPLREPINKSLSITQQQLTAIDEAILKQQFERIYHYIIKHHQNDIAGLSTQVVMGQTLRAIKRGRSYGFNR